jgi:hypothetical protein
MIIVKTRDGREMAQLAELLKKFADTDDWAVARLAELRANGKNASARVVVWVPHPIGTAFAVHVRRASGEIEHAPGDEVPSDPVMLCAICRSAEGVRRFAVTVDGEELRAVAELCAEHGGQYLLNVGGVMGELFQKGSSRS